MGVSVARSSLPWTLAVLVGGCATLSRKPTDENVIMARQLALQGNDAEQRGRLEQAEAWYSQSLETNPRDERTQVQYAQLLWRRGDHQGAIQHQVEGVRLSGGDPVLLTQLGEMYLQDGSLNSASAQVDQAIGRNRNLPAAWALRGDIQRQYGDWDGALASYHRALSLQPNYPQVLAGCADIYRRQNRPRRELAVLHALADSFPPGAVPAAVLVQQGTALQAIGRHEEAAEKLASAAAARVR